MAAEANQPQGFQPPQWNPPENPSFPGLPSVEPNFKDMSDADKARFFDWLVEEIKGEGDTLTIKFQSKKSDKEEGEICACLPLPDCDGKWAYPSPGVTSALLKHDTGWIPCTALIKRLEKNLRDLQARFSSVYWLFEAYGVALEDRADTRRSNYNNIIRKLKNRRSPYDINAAVNEVAEVDLGN